MRKLLALIVIVAIGYVAVTGSARVSDDTASLTDGFACGVAESTRSAVGTVEQAVRATAGLVRDNSGGAVQDAAQWVVDVPTNATVQSGLQGWVTETCG